MTTLKRAPDLPTGHPCYPGLYDSVQGGPHSGSLMWIVYHSDQAYPIDICIPQINILFFVGVDCGTDYREIGPC